MPLNLTWIDESQHDRVAEARLRCYAGAAKDLKDFRETLRSDPRSVGSDIVLAEQDGLAVGTATAIPLTMWVRGGSIPCQGVAYVGTIKTHRRGGDAGTPGIATQIMRETIRHARDRGQVVSALMPWRASFYEHFGYGLAEQRCEWTVPLSVLPVGDFSGVKYNDASDLDALLACRQRIAEAGQCDIERSRAMWLFKLGLAEDGFVAVDRPKRDGPLSGWIHLRRSHENGKDILRIPEIGFDDVLTLRRLLCFVASLRDQYLTAVLTLPADLPLNRLLRETQIPHRPVNHATAEVRAYTRMQIRILDHRRFLEAMGLPVDARGRTIVSIRETEGHESRFAIDIADGSASVTTSTADAQFECSDVIWASVASGDLSASAAVRLGLARCADSAPIRLMDVFAQGPLPYCGEYF